MTDAELTQINIRIPLSQKEEWEDFIESNARVDNLSHLIRYSVSREMQRGDHPAHADEMVDMDELQSQINRLEGTVKSLRDDLESVRMMQSVDPRKQELKQNLLRLLPTSNEIFDSISETPDDFEGKLSPPVVIADMLDVEDAEMVTDALEDLREEVSGVHRVQMSQSGDEMFDYGYYKVT